MFIKFGTSLYGKVDVVPGLGFVATKFFHVMLVPIAPLGCWFVEEGSEGRNEEGDYGWKGVEIPFCGMSVLFAYGRAAALVGAAFLGIMAIPGLAATPQRAWVAGIGALACAAAVFASYRINGASLNRALELAERVGVPAEEVEERYRPRRP